MALGLLVGCHIVQDELQLVVREAGHVVLGRLQAPRQPACLLCFPLLMKSQRILSCSTPWCTAQRMQIRCQAFHKCPALLDDESDVVLS